MNLVTREQWGADVDAWRWNSGRRAEPIAMSFPVTQLWVHHSVSLAHDDDGILEPTDDPAGDMRRIEATGMARFGRFSYSYAVHPNGTVLQGCGDWIGAHTLNRNSKALGVVFIGNYENQVPTPAAIWSFVDLTAWLVAGGRLAAGGRYPTGGHRDVSATACPGRHLYAHLGQLRALIAAHPQGDDDMTTPDDVRAIVDERLVHHGLDRAYERTLAAAGNAGHALQLARELCRRAGMTDAEIEAIEGR